MVPENLQRLAGLSVLVALVAAGVACQRSTPSSGSSSTSAASRPVHKAEDLRKLTVYEVEERVNAHDGKLAIYDCNSKEQYEGAHLPGARWLDFNAVTASDLPRDKTTTLVFYCYQDLCNTSHTAALAAEDLGYVDVFIMPAGIRGWLGKRKPVEKGGA
jgi:rhodanese-related sulfurtransferase